VRAMGAHRIDSPVGGLDAWVEERSVARVSFSITAQCVGGSRGLSRRTKPPPRERGQNGPSPRAAKGVLYWWTSGRGRRGLPRLPTAARGRHGSWPGRSPSRDGRTEGRLVAAAAWRLTIFGGTAWAQLWARHWRGRGHVMAGPLGDSRSATLFSISAPCGPPSRPDRGHRTAAPFLCMFHSAAVERSSIGPLARHRTSQRPRRARSELMHGRPGLISPTTPGQCANDASPAKITEQPSSKQPQQPRKRCISPILSTNPEPWSAGDTLNCLHL
jgi:hypothetical protein